MGTDIHLAAEVRNDEGEWEYVPGPITDCGSCRGTGFAMRYDHDTRQQFQTNEPCRWCCTKPEDEEDPFDRQYTARRYVGPGKQRDTWYSDRNYTVFAILGNVRNGTGFAGVYTHDPLPSIADHRGIPEDATPNTLCILSDEHSGTWCLLSEIMDYDWHQPQHRGGVITLAQYQVCRDTGVRPDTWVGGISGGNVITVDPAWADSIIAGGQDAYGREVHVQYEWDDTLDDYTKHFLDRMKMLAMEVGERECRLVMDFDS